MQELPPELVQAVADWAGASGLAMRRVCVAWYRALPWEWVAANYSWRLAADAGVSALARRAQRYAIDRDEVEDALQRAGDGEPKEAGGGAERWLGAFVLDEKHLRGNSFVLTALAVRAAPDVAETVLRRALCTAETSDDQWVVDLVVLLASRLGLEQRRCAALPPAPWAPPLLAARLTLLAGNRPAATPELLAACESPSAWYYPDVLEISSAAPTWECPEREESLPLRTERWAVQTARLEWPERVGSDLLWEVERSAQNIQCQSLMDIVAGFYEIGASTENWRRIVKIAAEAGREPELRVALERAQPTPKLYREWITAAVVNDQSTAGALLKHAAGRLGNVAYLRIAAVREAFVHSSGRVLEELSRGYRTHAVRRELRRMRQQDPREIGAEKRFVLALITNTPGVAQAIHRALPEERETLEEAAATAGCHYAAQMTAASWRTAFELGRRRFPSLGYIMGWSVAGVLSGREHHRPLLRTLQKHAPPAEWFAAAATEALAQDREMCGAWQNAERYVAALLETDVHELSAVGAQLYCVLAVWLWPLERAAEKLRAVKVVPAFEAALYTSNATLRQKILALVTTLAPPCTAS
jgi:hypothetical protein